MNKESRNISVILQDNESLVEENRALRNQLRLFQENCSLRAATVFASLLSWLDSDKTRTTQTEVAVRKLEEVLKSCPAEDLPDIKIQPPSPAFQPPVSRLTPGDKSRPGKSRPSSIPSPTPVRKEEAPSLQEAYENWASYKNKNTTESKTRKSETNKNSLDQTGQRSNESSSQKHRNEPLRIDEEESEVIYHESVNQSLPPRGNYTDNSNNIELRRASKPHFVQNYSDGYETESALETSSEGEDDQTAPKEWSTHGHVWNRPPNKQQPNKNTFPSLNEKPHQQGITESEPPRTLWKDVLSPEFRGQTLPSPQPRNNTNTSVAQKENFIPVPVHNVRSKSPNNMQLGLREKKEVGTKYNQRGNMTPSPRPNNDRDTSVAQRENFLSIPVRTARSKSPNTMQLSVRKGKQHTEDSKTVKKGNQTLENESVRQDNDLQNFASGNNDGMKNNKQVNSQRKNFIPVQNARSKSPNTIYLNTMQQSMREGKDRTGDYENAKKGSREDQNAFVIQDANLQNLTSGNNDSLKNNQQMDVTNGGTNNQDTGFQSRDNTRQQDDLSVGYDHVGFPVASSTPQKKGQVSSQDKSEPGLPSPSVRDRSLDVSYWGQTNREEPLNLEREAILWYLNRAEPKKRLIGEVAYQLDRRILSYIFSIKGDDHQRRRFYGFTLQNLTDMIVRESVDRNTGDYDVSMQKRLSYRLEYILRSLFVYGYSLKKHSIISADLVNRYGLLPIPDSLETASLFNVKNKAIIGDFLDEITPESDLDDVKVLFECLCLLAQDEEKPLFIW